MTVHTEKMNTLDDFSHTPLGTIKNAQFGHLLLMPHQMLLPVVIPRSRSTSSLWKFHIRKPRICELIPIFWKLFDLLQILLASAKILSINTQPQHALNQPTS
jgi:hypothetical protein